MTIAARVPRLPSASTMPATVAGGVQITARSGVSGSSAALSCTRSPSRSVLGIDRADRPGEGACAQVAPDGRADAALALRSTEHGDGAGTEERGEVSRTHGIARQTGYRVL